MIPVEIWIDPMWWQFVGDTLPEMVYASAWTMLVTFFVQLVGVATGTGTNTTPGLVISVTVRAFSVGQPLPVSWRHTDTLVHPLSSVA
jgi:hypothetical protein